MGLLALALQITAPEAAAGVVVLGPTGLSATAITLIIGGIVAIIGAIATAVVTIITAWHAVASKVSVIEGHVNSEKTAAEGRERTLQHENALLREMLNDRKTTAQLLAQARAIELAPTAPVLLTAPAPRVEVAPPVPRILIVEDDPDIRLGLFIILKAAHYFPVLATDGVSAMSTALAHHPDLIVLDLGLPAGDGFTVLEWCRAEPALAQIPVIVVSGRDRTTHEPRALHAGAYAYFQKPWANDSLLATIQRALGASETTPAIDVPPVKG